MKSYLTYSLILALFATISIAFSIDESEPLFVKPDNFPEPIYDFSQNPLTTDGVALGKALFYDALLSKDNTISCGSCHQQSAGFTQHGHPLSHGINDLLTKRNSMPLANLAWSRDFGWDGGVHHLDLFPVSPLQNPAEMDETLANVLEKLEKTSTYPILFQKAFGTDEINTERFLKALSQFMLTMVSANSKYDKFMRNEGEKLTDIELEGKALVEQKCASCHSGALFSDFKYRNNGLIAAQNSDLGCYDVTLLEEDRFTFKVPTLRNLASTAPYMHDGRFGTLDEVLEHYNSGVEKSSTLDPLLNKNGQLGISLNADEKTKIIAFLRTLNDESFLRDDKFSEFSKKSDPETEKYKNTDWEKADLQTNNAYIKTSFETALRHYINIKNAMAAENGEAASQAAAKFLNVLSNIDKTLMTPMQRVFLQIVYEDLSFDTEHVNETKDYKHQRDHFGDLSKNFFRLVKAFKTNSKPLYYYHCPNAFYKQGSYWIGENENDKNPYFTKNKECGVIKTVILPPF